MCIVSAGKGRQGVLNGEVSELRVRVSQRAASGSCNQIMEEATS